MWIRKTYALAGKSPTNKNRSFWLSMCPILFLVFFSACQPQNSKPASTIAKNSQPLTKPTNRSDWRNLLGWNDDCEQSFSQTQAGVYSGIESYPLGDADELVIVMCAAGSYQPSFLLFRLKQQIPSVLSLETYLTGDGETLYRSQETEFWGDPAFDTNTKELVILNASRQTKDCGTWAKYSFTSDMAKLKEFLVKLPCPNKINEPVNLEPAIPPKGWKPINPN
jgi:hypothetical protein